MTREEAIKRLKALKARALSALCPIEVGGWEKCLYLQGGKGRH